MADKCCSKICILSLTFLIPFGVCMWFSCLMRKRTMGRRLSFLKGPKQQTVNGELGIREVAATMSRRGRHWEIVAHAIAAKESSGQSKKLSNVYFISIYVYMCINFIVVELKEKVEETIIKQYRKKMYMDQQYSWSFHKS